MLTFIYNKVNTLQHLQIAEALGNALNLYHLFTHACSSPFFTHLITHLDTLS